MGLFKNVANFVTGGAAEVQLELINPVLDNEYSMDVVIRVKPTGDTIHAKRLYLEVQVVEESSTKNVLYRQEHILSEDLQINQGDGKEWSFRVELPTEVPPTYLAKYFSVKWGIKASLDMPGVDPNSGWQPFVLNKEVGVSELM